MRKSLIFGILMLVMICSAAAFTSKISYTGFGIVNASNGKYYNGNQVVQTKIYYTKTGGASIAGQTNTTKIYNGTFSVIFLNTSAINFSRDIYIESVIAGTTISPRLEYTSVPNSQVSYSTLFTKCSGTSSYLDGTGVCDDISTIYYDSLNDLKSSVSNDFHNLGGTDRVNSTADMRKAVNSTVTYIFSTTGTAVATSDSTWTAHNSYPAACSAGQYVSALGDLLTCGTPTDTNTYNSSAQMRAAVNITNAIYLFIAKNITGVLADRQVVDTITASNYVRKSTWTDIDSYPSACAAGQYVTAIGDTLTCDTPSGSGGGAGDKWLDGGTYITPNTTYASNVKIWGSISATDWSNASITNWATQINSYPSACAAGTFATTIGDTLTCNRPAGNTTSDMVKAVNVSNAVYSFIAKNITGILRDSQVSDTLTCSNLVSGSSVVSDAEVDDTITASNYVRKSTWTDIDSYPSACSAGYFVSTIGDTLTCTRPSLATQAAGWTNTSTQTTTSLNVGVGTTSPDTLFEIEGTSASEGYIVASIANLKNDGRAELALDTDAGAYAGFIAQAGSATSYGANNMEIGTRVNGGIAFWSYNAERMRLTPTGKLGIGTTVPNSNLHVIGNINATINVTTNRIYASGNITSSDKFVLKTGSYIRRIYVNSSGSLILE